MKITVVILAAGRGTRMKSNVPKVLHHVGGQPLIWHVVQQAKSLKPQNIIVVVPQDGQSIQDVLKDEKNVKFAVQKKQLGTGSAVQSALPQCDDEGVVVVLNGDMPLFSSEKLKLLIKTHTEAKAQLSLTTLIADSQSDFGRIVRNDQRHIVRIVELKDALPEEKNISEVNVGVYAFDAQFLKHNIRKLKAQNAQNEYYLTDLVSLAVEQKKVLNSITLTHGREALGVNSQSDLNLANQQFYALQREKFMSLGVVCVGSEIFIEALAHIENGVHLESPCYVKGSSHIAHDAHIEMGVVVRDSFVGAHSRILSHSYIQESCVEEHCSVGPFAHLRPKTVLKPHVKVGNFVEIKNSTLGQGTKASHLSYLGDATLGQSVNVGAGTITCNYDGVNKFKTILEDGVFVGSDTQLVAPVRVGRGAFLGAGSTITRNVDAYALALSRVSQVQIKNWAKKRQKNNIKK